MVLYNRVVWIFSAGRLLEILLVLVNLTNLSTVLLLYSTPAYVPGSCSDLRSKMRLTNRSDIHNVNSYPVWIVFILRILGHIMAEKVGLEPTDPFGSPDFESGAVRRLATSPKI